MGAIFIVYAIILVGSFCTSLPDSATFVLGMQTSFGRLIHPVL